MLIVSSGAKNLNPVRVYLSSYMTSLNAPGFSISLLNLSAMDREHGSDALKGYLDDPTDATAWVGVRFWPRSKKLEARPGSEDAPTDVPLRVDGEQDTSNGPALSKDELENYFRLTRAACHKIMEIEGDLTTWDTEMGDGDCGETLANGANAVSKLLDGLQNKPMDISQLVGKVGDALEDAMGGTIGARKYILLGQLCSC
jgi:triose/dihydroxyacetone kinase / FAD-AMP lyase (cyclizing)